MREERERKREDMSYPNDLSFSFNPEAFLCKIYEKKGTGREKQEEVMRKREAGKREKGEKEREKQEREKRDREREREIYTFAWLPCALPL